jgi:hypothetical protein
MHKAAPPFRRKGLAKVAPTALQLNETGYFRKQKQATSNELDKKHNPLANQVYALEMQ